MNSSSIRTKIKSPLSIILLISIVIFLAQLLAPGISSKTKQMDVLLFSDLIFGNWYLIWQIFSSLMCGFLLIFLFNCLIWYSARGFHLITKLSERELSLLWVLLSLLSWFAISLINHEIYQMSKFDLSVPDLMYGNEITPYALASKVFLITLCCLALLFAVKSKLAKTDYVIISAIVLIICVPAALKFNNSSEVTDKPNIIIIGTDSVSPVHLAAGDSPKYSELLKSFYVFEDASTTLPRTFSAWNSILSGHYPYNNGARFNLVPRENIDSESYVGNRLREHGYRTAFAMDERLFSNIDESYGFDDVIGPRVGAIDFITAKNSDAPLNNVLMHYFPLVRTLLPNAYANRAADTIYLPNDFNEEIERYLDNHPKNEPLFFVNHFCVPHYPYFWGENFEKYTTKKGYFNERAHPAAIERVAGQVTQLLDNLKENGLLNNAIVFLISDHGEQVTFDKLQEIQLENYRGSDTPTMSDALRTLTHYKGHGVNLFDPAQTRVIMAYQIFRNGTSVLTHDVDAAPKSLVDIYPTILSFLELDFDDELFDGKSFYRSQGDAKVLGDRIRYLETGIYYSALADINKIDEKKVLEYAAAHYEVSNDYPLVQLKQSYIKQQLNNKVRAYLWRNWVVLRVAHPVSEKFRYIFYNNKEKWWTNDFRIAGDQGVPVESLTTKLQALALKDASD